MVESRLSVFSFSRYLFFFQGETETRGNNFFPIRSFLVIRANSFSFSFPLPTPRSILLSYFRPSIIPISYMNPFSFLYDSIHCANILLSISLSIFFFSIIPFTERKFVWISDSTAKFPVKLIVPKIVAVTQRPSLTVSVSKRLKWVGAWR